jgi:hypothetical protein
VVRGQGQQATRASLHVLRQVLGEQLPGSGCSCWLATQLVETLHHMLVCQQTLHSLLAMLLSDLSYTAALQPSQPLLMLPGSRLVDFTQNCLCYLPFLPPCPARPPAG